MSDIPNCFYRTSIKALILDDQKRFLLVLEKAGQWELPGGGLDFGEKPHACLARELKEEMGVDAAHIADKPSYFVTAQTTTGYWKSNVVYETKIKNLDFIPSDECVELRFFTIEEALKENLYTTIKEFVKEYNPANHEPSTDSVK